MLQIDADCPGGNIVVEKTQGDEVWLAPDLRDTEGWWFYWLIRVRGAAGRRITFHFPKPNVLTPAGVSLSDDGVNYRWVAPEPLDENSFALSFPANAPDAVFLTYSIPYFESNLRAFLGRYAGRPELRCSTLTTSERGRAVQLLHAADPAARRPSKILITARHHSCESVADYVLEGILDFALDRATGFLDLAEIQAVPFVDKDGVEDGDQGKNRRPHDHNRDYTDAPIYASVSALTEHLRTWADDRFLVALDLHCPWIRGGRNDAIFFVEPPEPYVAEFTRFERLLDSVQACREAANPGAPLHDPAHDLACGLEWNQATDPTCSKWMRDRTPARLVGSLEFSYGLASGRPVTADGARVFGRRFAEALLQWIQTRENP